MLTIITISYNSQKVLTQCLGPLIESGSYPTIIIDNASTDRSAELLQTRFPEIQLKALPSNIGYGRAANEGLRMVKTPYALLLNPDLTASVEEVTKLLELAYSDTGTAIWGPASKKEDYTKRPAKSVEWISGCAMLFDMEKLHEIGLFDENIFLFFEETDLCTRTTDAGFDIKHCQEVFFDHMAGTGSAPSPAVEALKDWHYGWSRCYYFSKHDANNKKRMPQRQYAQYKWKAFSSLNARKRRKYRLQANGAKAFLEGMRAFDENGLPFIPGLA